MTFLPLEEVKIDERTGLIFEKSNEAYADLLRLDQESDDDWLYEQQAKEE